MSSPGLIPSNSCILPCFTLTLESCFLSSSKDSSFKNNPIERRSDLASVSLLVKISPCSPVVYFEEVTFILFFLSKLLASPTFLTFIPSVSPNFLRLIFAPCPTSSLARVLPEATSFTLSAKLCGKEESSNSPFLYASTTPISLCCDFDTTVISY